ncbi:putative zinc-binding metallopeptidase [Frankia sp. R82]|uniref:zinc-binding metallopeptidase family protein n=1 Tax=Frankia sp. R82 TaxID=2950553 RepID=UPI002043B196|nr:putative zinc-binding metallopeptidase [Frankia sp. R82]MCM3882940.1 putative zinc-binding peptidase [Frankia sp. R82]
MKVNGCARCGQLVFFENSACLRCGAPLGFDPDQGRVITLVTGRVRPSSTARPRSAPVYLELPPVAVVAAAIGQAPLGDGGRGGVQSVHQVASPTLVRRVTATDLLDRAIGADPIAEDLLDAVPLDRRRWFYRCAASERAGCNWLVPAPATAADAARADAEVSTGEGTLCRCCRLTRTRPADSDPTGRDRFVRAEAAKRRLVAQLLELGLPVVAQVDDPAGGLAFDLLNSSEHAVVTGHSEGLITLDLAESDDAHRERVRVQLGEPYRTLLGHFRHEIGHYYWEMLVGADPARTARFRDLFGDPDLDYAAALDRHYAQGPPSDWRNTFVSAYATMHPWEDWAETFAHYLHIRDTLRTSAEFGLHVAGPDLAAFGVPANTLAAEPADLRNADDAAGRSPIRAIIDQWLPLTYALNAISRSMGRDDLYPFVLTPAVRAKLGFAHEMITVGARPGTASAASG